MNKILKQLEEAYELVANKNNSFELVNEIRTDRLKRVAPKTVEVPDAMKESNITTWSKRMFASLLTSSYRAKAPLFVYGSPGQGKSSIIEQFARAVAKQRGREFVSWTQCTQEQKTEISSNPSKYFVLVDQRVAFLNPTDIQGIPEKDLANNWVKYMKADWIVILCKPETDGILFLDELNQGHPAVMNAMMQVVLDRNFDGTPMSKNYSICAAGNLMGEGNVRPIEPNLMDRFKLVGILILEPAEWIEYAKEKGINPWIINFVQTDPSQFFYQKPTAGDQKFVTPRTLSDLSGLLEVEDQRYDEYDRTGEEPDISYSEKIREVVASSCGTRWAREFMTFLEYTHVFDVEHVARDPKDFAEKHLTQKEEPSEKKTKKEASVFHAGESVLQQGKVQAYRVFLAQQIIRTFEKATEDNDFKVDVKDQKVADTITAFWKSFEILPDDWIRVLLEDVIRKLGGQTDFKAKMMIASQELGKIKPGFKELVAKGLLKLKELKVDLGELKELVSNIAPKK